MISGGGREEEDLLAVGTLEESLSPLLCRELMVERRACAGRSRRPADFADRTHEHCTGQLGKSWVRDGEEGAQSRRRGRCKERTREEEGERI
eukprot:483354-Hanusia_phi.AAC.1